MAVTEKCMGNYCPRTSCHFILNWLTDLIVDLGRLGTSISDLSSSGAGTEGDTMSPYFLVWNDPLWHFLLTFHIVECLAFPTSFFRTSVTTPLYMCYIYLILPFCLNSWIFLDEGFLAWSHCSRAYGKQTYISLLQRLLDFWSFPGNDA